MRGNFLVMQKMSDTACTSQNNFNTPLTVRNAVNDEHEAQTRPYSAEITHGSKL